ncbi:MAG: zinc ribbon domain-containing protein [Chloroflexi bacterium]|nr:zinc ribbon domain-containing protein [Chloroflexota bacterium]
MNAFWNRGKKKATPRRWGKIVAFSLSSLLLLITVTACIPIQSIDTQLTLGKEEAWEIEIRLALTPDGLAYASMIIPELSNWANGAIQAGADASWEALEPQEGEGPVYLMKAKGVGYAILNSVVLDQEAVTVIEIDGKRHIQFYYQGSDLFGIVPQYQFTLKGGQVISTNGQQVNDSTVEWFNPVVPMEAVMREPSNLIWLWLLLGLAGGMLLLAMLLSAGLLIGDSQRKKPAAPATAGLFTPALQAQGYCTQCGAAIPAAAQFCPACGARRM